MEIKKVPISQVEPWEKNPRNIKTKDFERLKKQILELGVYKPLICYEENGKYITLGGNMRLLALRELGIPEVEISIVHPKSEAEKIKYSLSDNDRAGEYDEQALAELVYPHIEEINLEDFKVDLGDAVDLKNVIEDFAPDLDEREDEIPEIDDSPAITQPGDLYQLGRHRLLCGDATKEEDVKRLMRGEKADMVFTDPPYGIGKDILNDNLKETEWLDFYTAFTNNMLMVLKENGYFYVWGYFETLSNYWENIIKKNGRCNFRNFIIWVKSYVEGINSPEFRQFPENYGACLLCIYGQPFQNGPWSTSPNAEFYWKGFDKIRLYLDGERKKMGWDILTVKKIVGHSDLSGDHWFGKSQWSFPTKEVYKKLQEAASGRAFLKEYDKLRKEYEELRGYFDNTNGWTDVWFFDKLTTISSHPTVKPIEVCQRGILTNSRFNETVLDLFLGSGSTLIACEKLNRICHGMEIEPKYCDIIIKRYSNFTGIPEEEIRATRETL